MRSAPAHENVEVLEVRQGDGANGRMRARLRFLLKGWLPTVALRWKQSPRRRDIQLRLQLFSLRLSFLYGHSFGSRLFFGNTFSLRLSLPSTLHF